MTDFKARCSKLGILMTEPRNKADKDAGNLSESAKSYVQEQYLFDKYGIRKEVHDQKLIKGKMCEEEAISLVQQVRGNESLLIKNDKRLSNSFISGEYDLMDSVNSEVIDTKVAWDVETFHNNEGVLTKTGRLTHYGWQLIGYAWLAEVEKATLAYTWVDTPEFMVSDLIRRAYFKYDHSDEVAIANIEDEIEFDIRSRHCPTQRAEPVPIKERVRLWQMKININKYIPLITQRVEKANEYYQLIDKSWKATQFSQQLSV